MRKFLLLVLTFIIVVCDGATAESPQIQGLIDPANSNTAFACTEGARLLLSSDEVSAMHRYNSVFYVFDCDSEASTILLGDSDGGVTELARFPMVWGADTSVNLLSSSRNGYSEILAVTLSFEHGSSDDADDTYQVDLYDLQSMSKIFAGNSRDQPEFRDLNGDGALELVLSENLFSIGHFSAPGWPWIVEVSSPVRHASIRRFPSVLSRYRLMSIDALKAVEETCEVLAPDSCPHERTLPALAAQIEALDFMISRTAE